MRTRVGAGLVLVTALAAGAPCAFAQVDESQVKAAFVYNIVAFASWNGAKTSADLEICTDTGGALDREIDGLAGRSIGQRRIRVRRGIKTAHCDVVLHAGAGRLVPADLAQPVLVICDGCRPRDGLTAVVLVREGNRIRFDVDSAAAAKSGVSFSSQLLCLARRVI
jgi:hypothetical protein